MNAEKEELARYKKWLGQIHFYTDIITPNLIHPNQKEIALNKIRKMAHFGLYGVEEDKNENAKLDISKQRL